MSNLAFLFVLLFGIRTSAETIKYVYRNPQDSSHNCYLIRLPDTKDIKGLIVRDYSALPDTSQRSPYQLQALASQNGMAILYVVSSTFFPEMFYDDSGPTLLDDIVNEVLREYSITRKNVFIGGISASGTRALRYAQYCEEGKSKFGIKVKGVFVVDSPLDLERFYYSAKNHMPEFKAGMLEEAKMMVEVLPKKLGGTPAERPQAYIDASVYSFRDSAGGNARFYKKLPILIFHEPDISWWIEERGSTYYDMNSFDLAAFTNKMRSLGNTKVELITTTGKGFDSQGKRKPHSWTIVDEEYLIKWIVEKIDL